MRYKPEQKAETRQKIANAAQQCFKQAGYGGVGIDGIAKEAGVTSGAFYVHFKSKEDAFKHAVVNGLSDLNAAISELKHQHGENWWADFATFYLTDKRLCSLSDSCALQSLTPEVSRASADIKQFFEAELLKVVNTASNGNDQARTWARLAMLIGGVTLARAVQDNEIANDIAEAVKLEVSSL